MRRTAGTYFNKLLGLSDEQQLHEVAGQVVSNAIVCDVKAKRCKPALVLTGCALALYALSVIPYSSMAFGHSAQAPREHSDTPVASLALAPPAHPDVPKSPTPILPYTVPIATICGAIGGAAVTSFVTRRNAKEQNALASRTKLADFREAWLNHLRDAIAELGAELLDSSNRSSDLNRRRIYELVIKIRLLMNRKDPRYSVLDGLLLAGAGTKAEEIISDKFISELTTLAQDILKTEWETLKYDLEYEPPRVKKSNPSRVP